VFYYGTNKLTRALLQVDILHHPSTDEGALDVFVKVFTGEPGMFCPSFVHLDAI